MESGLFAEETFDALNLDKRLVLSLMKGGFQKPTIVQKHVVEFAQQGKDVLTKAATGSGKTLAYCIPLMDSILKAHAAGTSVSGIKAIVLVPTQELCTQVVDAFRVLTSYCSDIVAISILNQETTQSQLKKILNSKPDIVVSTPGKVAGIIRTKTVDVSESLQFLVVDEGDLLLSYGYENDIRIIIEGLNRHVQSFIMSATLTDDILRLKGMVLHNPVNVKLEEAEGDLEARLSQFFLMSDNEDQKFLFLYAIFKFHLIPGKCMVFVNTIDQCYRVRLFLERFSIRCAVVNAELPIESRLHILSQFSRGMFDFLVVTDSALDADEEAHAGTSKKDAKQKKRETTASSARGLDLRDVEGVIIFDFPESAVNYVHRVGRTARAGASGSSLLLFSKQEQSEFDQLFVALTDSGREIRPFTLNHEEIQSFKYRVEDSLRSVTKLAVRDARMLDMRREILHNSKLKSRFAEKQDELDLLRHDLPVSCKTRRAFDHLKNVPSYLNPQQLVLSETQALVKDVVEKNAARKRELALVPYAKPAKKARYGSGKGKRKGADPLKSLRK
nr:ATP-dependent RNA helicase [Andalucia godoyi]|eukprot:ANDGO_03946.mRNA.1 ATP-dependent RNA helicase dbp9